jgi:hypothetical protein
VSVGYTTIITRIIGDVDALKVFLRTDIEPTYDPATILRCRPGFPFDAIGSLHFCSFSVLDGDGEFPPYLVFEATFDCSRDFFLDALLTVAPSAIDDIYRHCEGYPTSRLEAPELVKVYLASHDVGAQTFFRGSPGRTVEQVQGEERIYDALVNFVTRSWRQHTTMPTTYDGLQHLLQDKVVCRNPGNRWAEQMAAVPWEVTGRQAVAAAAVASVLALATGLGVLVLGWFGIGPFHVDRNWSAIAQAWSDFLFSNSVFGFVNDLGNKLGITIPLPLLGLLVIWAAVRFFELFLDVEDPRRKLGRGSIFFRRYLVHILVVLRYGILVIFVGTAVLLLAEQSFHLPYRIPALIGALILLPVLWHWETSFKLAVQFQELERVQESVRCLLVDFLRLGMVVLIVLAVYIIKSYLPMFITSKFEFVLLAMRVLVVFAIYAFVGVLIAYFLGLVGFLIVRSIERGDRKRFSSADGLTTMDNSSVYAREEHGVNTYQNHLVSLTYVKPGFLRKWFVRLTLFFIGLLSRFWFNVGVLGDIPTILSARWVLIDDCKRLLFLDHYGGAWDSYLNEFIDMGAVKGLNAIWTNTFIKVSGSQYMFPETEYYFWKGAQVERPFKAYVRQSQIETIVWYSAYPRAATINVNTNTDVRQSLFESMPACETDSLLQNL